MSIVKTSEIRRIVACVVFFTNFSEKIRKFNSRLKLKK